MEEKDTIVTLIDEENGQPVDFDLLLTFSYEGKRYAALQPLDEVEAFQQQLIDTGIEECAAQKQAAYDRYMSRD